MKSNPARRATMALAGLLGLYMAGCSGSKAPARDAMLDGAGDLGPQPAHDGQPDMEAAVDTRPDVFVPFRFELTVNQIPQQTNGSQPFRDQNGVLTPFRLALPPHGFTIDILLAGTHALPATLSVSVDKSLGGGVIPMGTELGGLFTIEGAKARWRVPASHAFPLGPVTVEVRLDDDRGTQVRSLAFDVAQQGFAYHPLRLEDPWVVDFGQDLYTIGSGLNSQGHWTLRSSAGGNGLADFEEDLRTIGLGTAEMRPDAAAVVKGTHSGTNAIVREWVESEIIANVREIYLRRRDGSADEESIGVRIYRAGQPGAPNPHAFVHQRLKGAELEKHFSVISVGGGDLSRPLLGRSRTVDVNNLQNEDNVGPGFGIFSTSAFALVAKMLESNGTLQLLLTPMLGDLVPELGRGGLRIGEHEADAQIFAEGFDPDLADGRIRMRYQRIAFVVRMLGQLLGALTAHEMGHALGLVADGPPPQGLFGGVSSAEFLNGARTNSGHVDSEGFNLMAAGPGSAPLAALDFGEFLLPGRFNALNRAYLQGRIVVLGD